MTILLIKLNNKTITITSAGTQNTVDGINYIKGGGGSV